MWYSYFLASGHVTSSIAWQKKKIRKEGDLRPAFHNLRIILTFLPFAKHIRRPEVGSVLNITPSSIEATKIFRFPSQEEIQEGKKLYPVYGPGLDYPLCLFPAVLWI
jgi:hypothetical protein